MQATLEWQQASWQEACEYVERWRDGRGRRMDQGVIETVAALNLLGIATSQSCEGHLDHGLPFPWILISHGPSDQYEQEVLALRRLEQEAKQCATEDAYIALCVANLQLRLAEEQWNQNDEEFPKLTALVEKFYAIQQKPPSPARLIVERYHPGLYRIQPIFGQYAKELPAVLKVAYLAQGQAEMQAFTHFLKRLWQQRQDGLPETQAVFETQRRDR